jgi:hypothetical protein
LVGIITKKPEMGSPASNASHCFDWSGRQDLNLLPPAPHAGKC